MEIYVVIHMPDFFKPDMWCIPVTPTLRRLKWTDREFQIILFIQLEFTSQNKTPTSVIHTGMVAQQKKGRM